MAKKKKKVVSVAKKNPKKYVKEAARKLPIDSCWLNSDYTTSGATNVFVLRKKRNGNFLVGVYWIDIFGLGLRNTMFLNNKSDEDIKLLLGRSDLAPEIIQVEPNFAFNLIYGAIEYAEDIGLAPHSNFEITEYILPPVESIEYIEIEFGSEGKPLLILDNHNANAILKRVTATIGAENFHYMINVQDDNELNDYFDNDDEDEDDFYDEDDDLDENTSYVDYEDITPKK